MATIFFIHAGFMTIGTLLMTTGIIIAIYLRSRTWWLKRHKQVGVAGACFFISGLIAAYLMVMLSGQGHLKILHAYFGTITIIFTLLTLSLGFLQFLYKTITKKIRLMHRWSGRITLALAFITILSGIYIAGIF